MASYSSVPREWGRMCMCFHALFFLSKFLGLFPAPCRLVKEEFPSVDFIGERGGSKRGVKCLWWWFFGLLLSLLRGERDFSRREMVSGLRVFKPSVCSCWQCSLLEEGGTVAKGPRQELGFCFPCLITKSRDMVILKDLLSDFCAISEIILR